MREGKVIVTRINILTKRLHRRSVLLQTHIKTHIWKCTGALTDKSEVSESFIIRNVS